MSDPTQPNEPVPPQDPTQQMPSAGVTPPPGTATTTTTTTAEPPPPSGGGLSGGAVAAIAIGAAAVALLIGFLIWGGDDDDAEPVAEEVTTTAPVDTEPEDTSDDEIAALQGQVDDLQGQLDDVTAERDDLQAQLDEATGTTVELENVEGRSIDEVRDLAADNGWELIEQNPEDAGEDTATDTVLSQSPDEGTAMSDGSVLVVEVVPS
jgi:hypothetical protein